MDTSQVQLFDVYEIWYNPWWKTTTFQVAFCILACLILSFLVYYLFKFGWLKKKLSFEQQVMKKLQNLSKESYQNHEQICNAYFELTLILKSYLAHRYALSLLDKTDAEILVLLKSVLVDTQYFVIEEFLYRTSIIKFSFQKTISAMLYDDIRFVEKFVIESCSEFDKVGVS